MEVDGLVGEYRLFISIAFLYCFFYVNFTFYVNYFIVGGYKLNLAAMLNLAYFL